MEIVIASVINTPPPPLLRYLFGILFNRRRRRHGDAQGADKLADFRSAAFIITGLL